MWIASAYADDPPDNNRLLFPDGITKKNGFRVGRPHGEIGWFQSTVELHMLNQDLGHAGPSQEDGPTTRQANPVQVFHSAIRISPFTG